MKNVSDIFLEEIKTLILRLVTFSPENHAVYKIMW